ncbi:MAG: hypothetical protein DI537_13705 [Stutzerimonas stutzeri]|nr:MAG: hypothetical protein DI537_13705 [Stutzerimonas stutzeri]
MRLKLKINLAPQRALAIAQIDELIEGARLRFVTPGSAQAMVYQQKYEEALAFIADPQIDPAEVPHIYGEIGITAPSPAEVAQVILNLRSLWRDVSALLEQLRLGSKQAIEQASTAEAIQEVIDAARAQLTSLQTS